LQVVLHQPQIPQNVGNVARTCASTHTPLHLIRPLGFYLTDRYLKRAGLDYWPHVDLTVHCDLETLKQGFPHCRWIYFSARAHRLYYDFDFAPGDCLVFGSETAGLPPEMILSHEDRTLCIPIDRSRVRSLNMATTVGVVLFEAIRQIRLRGGKSFGWFPAPAGEALAVVKKPIDPLQQTFTVRK
jgi:tRNA (cytidine/uridine-2'-O-)-methyltransferase